MEISSERLNELAGYATGLRATAPLAVIGAAADLLLTEDIVDWVSLTHAEGETVHWSLSWLTPTRLVHVTARRTQRVWWSLSHDGTPESLAAFAVARGSLQAVQVLQSATEGSPDEGATVATTYRLHFPGLSADLGAGHEPGARGSERIGPFVAALALG